MPVDRRRRSSEASHGKCCVKNIVSLYRTPSAKICNVGSSLKRLPVPVFFCDPHGSGLHPRLADFLTNGF